MSLYGYDRSKTGLMFLVYVSHQVSVGTTGFLVLNSLFGCYDVHLESTLSAI